MSADAASNAAGSGPDRGRPMPASWTVRRGCAWRRVVREMTIGEPERVVEINVWRLVSNHADGFGDEDVVAEPHVAQRAPACR